MLVRIKGIKKVKAKGRVYYYHRATRKRIHGQPGTPEFFREIEKLNARRAPIPEEGNGTLGAMIAAYWRSPEFGQLGIRTRNDYQRVFDYWQPLSAMSVETFNDSVFLIKLRDKAYKQHKRRFANYVVQVARLLLSWGGPRGFAKGNAGMSVPLLPRPKNAARANRPWKDHEREAVLDHAPKQLLAPIALGMFAGQRQQDVIAFPWRGYNGREIDWNALKNGRAMWLPGHPRLREILDSLRKSGTIVCLNAHGRPWTQSGFRASFFKLIRQLEAEGRVEPGLTFHGLRHTLGDMLADVGCDTRTIAAVLGITEEMAEHYSRGADRRRRAAAGMQKLVNSKRMSKKS